MLFLFQSGTLIFFKITHCIEEISKQNEKDQSTKCSNRILIMSGILFVQMNNIFFFNLWNCRSFEGIELSHILIETP